LDLFVESHILTHKRIPSCHDSKNRSKLLYLLSTSQSHDLYYNFFLFSHTLTIIRLFVMSRGVLGRCHVPWSSWTLLDMCPWEDILCVCVNTGWLVSFTLVNGWVHWRWLTSRHLRNRNVGCLHVDGIGIDFWRTLENPSCSVVVCCWQEYFLKWFGKVGTVSRFFWDDRGSVPKKYVVVYRCVMNFNFFLMLKSVKLMLKQRTSHWPHS
jgi:hypothetical protein